MRALGGEGNWRGGGVGYDERLSPSSGFHNHLQASREGDSAGGRMWDSLLDASSSLAMLGWGGISTIPVPNGDAWVGGTRGSWEGGRWASSLSKVVDLGLSGQV